LSYSKCGGPVDASNSGRITGVCVSDQQVKEWHRRIWNICDVLRHAVAQLIEGVRYKPEGCGFDSWWCHRNFSLTKSFWLHYDSGVDPASNRNKYQEYFLGVKAVATYSWEPYHFYVLTVFKSVSLNLLELSEPVQACHGITLKWKIANINMWPLGHVLFHPDLICWAAACTVCFMIVCSTVGHLFCTFRCHMEYNYC
jgi:hypothetical protein